MGMLTMMARLNYSVTQHYWAGQSVVFMVKVETVLITYWYAAASMTLI